MLAALLSMARPVGAEWISYSTDQFVVFYRQHPGLPPSTLPLELLAELVAAGARIQELTGATFRRFPVVIQDLGAYTNGLADPVYRRILMYPYDPEARSELSYATRPLRSLAVHELTHIGQLEAAAGFPLGLRAVFGPLLAPGLLSPAWLAEGLAVYAESTVSPHEGRLNDGAYDALVRAAAGEGSLPTLAQATFSTESYPGGASPYIWGGSFVRYLSGLKGEAALSAFLSGYARSVLSYLSPVLPLAGLDRMARQIWGKGVRGLWDDWRSQAAADALPREGRVVAGDDAVDLGGLRVVGRHLYYAETLARKTGRVPGRGVSRIARVDLESGERQVLVTTPGMLGAPFRIRDGRLYYAVADLEGGYANNALAGFGVTVVLRARPLEGGPDRAILRAPLRCFVVLADGLVLYAVDDTTGGGSVLWLAQAGREPRRLRVLSQRVLEMETDGSRLVLGARDGYRNEDLYTLDVADLDHGSLRVVTSTPWAERTPVLAGDLALYSANPEARRRVEGVDLASGETWVYETSEDAIWPVLDLERSQLVYVTATAEGPRAVAVPARAYRPSPTAESADALPPVSPPASVPDVRLGGWAPNLLTLAPRIRAPLVSTDFRSYFQAGLWLAGRSAIGDIRYSVRGLYDFTVGLPKVSASLAFSPMGPLGLTLGYDSFSAHTVTADVDLLPWRSLQSGLSWVRLGLRGALRGVFTSFDLTPWAAVGFRLPWVEADLAAYVNVESVHIGSLRDHVGLQSIATAGGALLGGELDLAARVAWDPQGPAASVPLIRGHTQAVSGWVAGSVELRYEHTLFRIRDGLWNPALYLGDVLVGGFFDGALSAAQMQLAAGLSLALETRSLALATGLPIVVEGWIGLDETASLIWGWGVSADLPEELEGRPPARRNSS